MTSEKAYVFTKDSVEYIYPAEKGKIVYWVGDFNDWQATQQIPYDKKRKAYIFKMPAYSHGIYFYKWVVDGEWILDPNNNDNYQNGAFGVNSVAKMPDFIEHFELTEDASVAKGQLEKFDVVSKRLAESREVFVYTPANYDSNKKYPLLVLQDGRECVELFPAHRIFDNLIHHKFCNEFICVLVSPKSSSKRELDYTFNDDFEYFLANELIEWLDQKVSISKDRNQRAIFGYSLGALVSVRTAIHYPKVYGLAGGESSAFWPNDGQIYKEMRELAPFDSKLYLGVGFFDGGEKLTALMGDFLQELGVCHQTRYGLGGMSGTIGKV
ncbi:alpha/beta hydrolase-fold protein, partial [bacterium]|nr:alpha/beta hydrolase-fold protein [bacterium]